MAKAINWPSRFREEVIEEPTDKLLAALRLGRLYYDNRYWTEGDVVLIRVNHKVIRRAQVVGDMKCCSIADLTPDDYAALKKDLSSAEEIARFLADTYGQEVTPQTEVTVVYYKNLPIDPEILEVEDDPHMF